MRAAAALVFLACGCKTPPALPPLPSAGGPAWTELTSEHFTMWTDGSLPRAHEMLRDMEHLRQVVLGVAFAQVPAEGRALVIAFRNEEEVGAFIPPQFDAMAFPRGRILQPMIVLNLAEDDDRSVITHELTHVISFGAIPEQPQWYAEGLATYFETVKLDAKQTSVEVGAVDPMHSRAFTLQHEGFVPAAQLFACATHACMDGRFYATVWALYTFLINAHPNELHHLQALLAALPANEQGRAWSEAFPDLPPAKLDHELATWFRYGRHTTWKYNAALAEPHITTRPLRDSDVNAARGVLRAALTDDKTEPPELAAALAADPTNLVGNLLVAWQHAPDAATAHAVATAHADDWRSWFLVTWATHDRDERRAARDKMCALVPNPVLVPDHWCDPEKQP